MRALLGQVPKHGPSRRVRGSAGKLSAEQCVRDLPRRVRPGTPMPEMGVTERDARDIAAYLYTLK